MQNYFASVCQFADPGKYDNGVRKIKHHVKAFSIPQGVGEWGLGSHLGRCKPLAVHYHENDDTEE